MKVTKRQLRRIIREERNKLNEAGNLPMQAIYETVHDQVIESLGEFFSAYLEDFSSPSIDDIRSLEKLVPEAAAEALEQVLDSVGIARRQRDD